MRSEVVEVIGYVSRAEEPRMRLIVTGINDGEPFNGTILGHPDMPAVADACELPIGML